MKSSNPLFEKAKTLTHPGQARKSWWTEDEMWYLERLGLHRYPVTQWPKVYDRPGTFFNRQFLIESYKSAFRTRKNWDLIDHLLVREYVEYESTRLEATAEAFDTPLVQLMDVIAPPSTLVRYLTEQQKKELNGQFKD